MRQVEFGMVSFDDISVESHGFKNVRHELDGVAELACDLAENGLFSALVLWRTEDETLVLIDGHRRHSAIKMLREAYESEDHFSEIACCIVDGDLDQALAKNLELALHGAEINPADAMDRAAHLYRSWGNQETVAAKIGKSQSWVSINLRIYTHIIPAVLEALRNGMITLTQANLLSEVLLEDGTADHERQKELLEAILTGKKVKKDEPKEDKPKTKRTKKEIAEMYQLAVKARDAHDIDRNVPETIIRILEWSRCRLDVPEVFTSEELMLDDREILSSL